MIAMKPCRHAARIGVGLLALAVVMSVPPQRGMALIDLKYTLLDMVRDAKTIDTGTLSPGDTADAWTLAPADALKGNKPKVIRFSLAKLQPRDADIVTKLLKSNADKPVIWFAFQNERATFACLHVSGTYLALSPTGDAWNVDSIAPKYAGIWAGGTDMLIQATRYILADPKADVPVAVGVSWMRDQARLGKVPGKIASLHAIELGPRGDMHLFVASDAGDRLMRAKEDDEAFEDITSDVTLQTRSKQALWMDLAGTGQLQLVSWDGQAITLWQLANDKFQAVGKGFTLKICVGLSPCRTPAGGLPALLVSTDGPPLLLTLGKNFAWNSAELPVGKIDDAGDATCPCVVADFDNDGYFDVLQPRSTAGLLWRGTADGFAAAVKSPVSCPAANGKFCVGDFNADGFVDVFISDPKTNELWENDGKAGFRPVAAAAGSLGYKSAPGTSFCCTADINHDGRSDLILLYSKAEFAYHFNRGYRCFGEEGGLRLPLPKDTPAGEGQVACVVADCNGDGTLDLVVAFADGTVACYYNDSFNKPMLRVRIGKGLAVPMAFSVWQGEKAASCLGVFTAVAAETSVPLRDLRDCEIRYILPGKKEQKQTIKIPSKFPDGGLEVIVSP